MHFLHQKIKLKVIYYFGGLVTVLISNMAVANEAFSLGTYSSPPYQYVENDEITGESISTLKCIFHKLSMDMNVDIYPFKRALRELASNKIEGVFPVHHPEKNTHNYSSPISIEKWYWLTNFRFNEKSFHQKNKHVGAVNGSAAFDWLIANNYSISTTLTTEDQLIKMFIAGRLDAIIIDNPEIFRDVEFHQSIENIKHYWRFIKFEPHHLAFSEQVLADNPKFLHQFNQQISLCSPVSLKITRSEKRLLQKYLKPYLSGFSTFLSKNNELIKLTTQFPHKSPEEIDRKWSQEVEGESGALYQFIMKSTLSLFLVDMQKSSNGNITEILAIDTDGYSIGLSQVTTDLFQGDEAQYLQTLPHDEPQIYISDVIYDDSTGTYQSQVSFSFQQAKSPISVITFGVNIEKVLSQQDK